MKSILFNSSSYEKFLTLLFRGGEAGFTGSIYDSNITSNICSMPCSKRREFFSINPIDSNKDHLYFTKKHYKEDVPRRADMNVSAFRNFMFEMDDVPLEEQLVILDKVGIPWTSIVYSGSKSYHAILAVSESVCGGEHTVEGVAAYKRIWLRIAAHINDVAGRSVVDETSKNPSRLSRFPWVFREKTGKQQELVSLGSVMELEQFNALVDEFPEVEIRINSKRAVDSEISVESFDAFKAVAPKGLLTKVKYPEWWAGEVGMYHELYKLTLWAIDSTDISYEVWLELLDELVYPSLIEAGYDQAKLYPECLAVVHAFNNKRGCNE